jgi:WD40 repeat protein
LIAAKWITGKDLGSMFFSTQDEQGVSSVLALHPCSKKAVNFSFNCAQDESHPETAVSKMLTSSSTLRTISPDGQYVLSGGFGATDTQLWSACDQRVMDVRLPPSVNSTFNSDSSAFALALSDRILVYDVKTFSSQELSAEEMTRPLGWKMTALALGPKNTSAEGKLFSATVGTARLWDLRTQRSEVLPNRNRGLLRRYSAQLETVLRPCSTMVGSKFRGGCLGAASSPSYCGGMVAL